MVDLKKILRKAFDKSSLENEDWLEPSASMLEEIEGRIYVKKKKRGWFFIVPALLILLTAGGICLGSKTMDGQSDSADENRFAKTETFNSTLSLNEDLITSSSEEDESIVLTEGANKTPIISVKNNLPKTLTSSAIRTEDFPVYQSSSQNRLVKESRFSTQNNSISKVENMSDASVVPDQKEVSRRTVGDISVVNHSIGLAMLGPLAIQKISSDKTLPAKLPVEVILPKKSTWSLVAGTSVSFWQFKLNDAYQTALDPADFESSNGFGVQTFIGLDKKLGSRFSVGAKLSYEQIGFTSGHNSTLGYDRNAETDMNASNTKMVIIATPVGFVDSDLTINRETDMAGSEVLIDIKNRHRIQSLDLALNLDYQFAPIFGLTPKISLGAGVQYITKLTNDLESFTPQQSGFSEGKGAIVAGQSSLNVWSPTITSGFGLEKKISKNFSIGINGNYMFNLNDLQEANEFNTRLNRFNGGIYLRRRF